MDLAIRTILKGFRTPGGLTLDVFELKVARNNRLLRSITYCMKSQKRSLFRLKKNTDFYLKTQSEQWELHFIPLRLIHVKYDGRFGMLRATRNPS